MGVDIGVLVGIRGLKFKWWLSQRDKDSRFLAIGYVSISKCQRHKHERDVWKYLE